MFEVLIFCIVLVNLVSCRPPIRLPVYRHVLSSSVDIDRGSAGKRSSGTDTLNVKVLPAVPPAFQRNWHVHYVTMEVGMSRRSAKVMLDSGSPDLVLLVGTSSLSPGPGHYWNDLFPFSRNSFRETYPYRASPAASNVSCLVSRHCYSDPMVGLTCGLLPGDLCMMVEKYADQSLRLGYWTRDLVRFAEASDTGSDNCSNATFVVSARLPQVHPDTDPSSDPVGAQGAGGNGAGGSTVVDAGHNNFDGTLGMSPTSVNATPSFFEQLCSADHELPRCAFALCLPNPSPWADSTDGADSGHLILGAYDALSASDRAMEPPFKWVPVVENVRFGDETQASSRFLVKVHQVQVRRSAHVFPDPQLFAVDSGSSLTVLPRDAFLAVAQAMLELCGSNAVLGPLCAQQPGGGGTAMDALFHVDGKYAVTMSRGQMAAFPPVTFQLDNGVGISLDWKGLFHEQPGNPGYYGLALRAAVQAEGHFTILGNNVIRGYQTVFDLQAQQIAFKFPVRCVPAPPPTPVSTFLEIGAPVGAVALVGVAVAVCVYCLRHKKKAVSTTTNGTVDDLEPLIE